MSVIPVTSSIIHSGNTFDSFKSQLSLRSSVYVINSSRSDYGYNIGTAENHEIQRILRGWNGSIDSQVPSLIIICASTGDVCAAVKYCNQTKSEFTIAGGKHSIFYKKTGCVMISLDKLRSVVIHEESKDNHVIYISGGCRNGDVDYECDSYSKNHLGSTGYWIGCALGKNTDTGVGGLLCGGGYGFVSRFHGFTIDALLEIEIVTYQGEIIRATPHNKYSDLFWAVRGCGQNFGVLTQVKSKTFKIGHDQKHDTDTLKANPGDIYGGDMIYDFKVSKQVLTHFHEQMESLNYKLPLDFAFVIAFIPGPNGKSITTALNYVGSNVHLGPDFVKQYSTRKDKEGKVIEPYLNTLRREPYLLMQRRTDMPLPYGRWHERSFLFKSLNEDIINIFYDSYDKLPTGCERSQIIIQGMGFGGNVNNESYYHAASVPKDTRESNYWVILAGHGDSDENAVKADKWVSDISHGVEKYANSFYANTLVQESVENLYRENLPKLKELKAKYDPNNVFRNNNNIKL